MTSVGRRLLAVLLPILVAGLLVHTIVASSMRYDRMLADLSDRADGQLRLIAASMETPLLLGDFQQVSRILETAVDGTEIDCLQLLVSEDLSAFQYGQCEPVSLRAADLEWPIRSQGVAGDGNPVRIAAWLSPPPMVSTLLQDALVDVVPLAILTLVFALVLLAANRRIIGLPLNRLARAMDATLVTQQRVSVGKRSRDEYGRLVDAYERLVDERQQHQTRLEDALRLAELGWFVLSEPGRPLRDRPAIWSQSLLEMLGLDPTAAPDTADGLISRINDQGRQRVVAVFDRQETGRLTFQCRGLGGRLLDLECIFRVEHDADGAPIRLFGIVQNVTERRAVEAALRERERDLALRNVLLATQQEASPDGLIAIGRDGAILSYNCRFVEMWDMFAPGEATLELDGVEARIAEMLNGAAHPRDFCLLREPQDSTTRCDVCLADGRIYECHASSLIEGLDTVFGWLWTFRDVTARRQAEAALAEAKEQAERERFRAEEVSAAKSRFLATMSHELRTPLNAIMGFSQIIGEEVYGPVGHLKYREYANDIGAAGHHLLDLISDILDMAKIESGKMQLSLEPLNLAQLIKDVVRKMKALARSADLALVIDDDASQLMATVDERAVRQILLNLISNAIKFTPAGGEVRVRVELEATEAIAISVADTGMGMSPEDVARVFEPFEQASSNNQISRPGTGLGLPIVKALIELHGGSVEMRSQRGQGTVVRVLLPPQCYLPHSAAA